jgi:uncharacterized membrane protein HdeD (DUF308 family)
MTGGQFRFEAEPVNPEARSQWGWFVVVGAALVVLGAIAFANLIAATLASVLFVGAMMTIGAVIQIVQAFRVKNWRGFLFWILGGALYGIAGVIAFYNPLLAAAALTLVLAFSLIVSGVLRAWLGLRLRAQAGWGWMVASGVITILAGIIFAAGWPANTLFLLGIVLAIDLIFQGVSSIGFGFALRTIR